VARHVLEAEAPFGEIDVANCALIRAARDGDVNELKHAVEAGADINTHLPVWIRIGSPEDIDVMGPPYGDVEWIDSRASALGSGFTPLMHASHEGHHEVVKLLLRLGASMHNRDTDGMQALHLAAQVGSLECVRALLEAGSDPLSLDEFNRTAMECAPSGAEQHACLAILKEHAGVSALVDAASGVVDTKEVDDKVASTVAGAASEVAECTEMDRDATASEETLDRSIEIAAASCDTETCAEQTDTVNGQRFDTGESCV